MKNNKYLTSLALFRELYDNKKRNIYEVLSEFIKDTIFSKNLRQFSAREITDLLNEMYDFLVPEAVIKASLKNLDFLTKENGVYSVNYDDKYNNSGFSERYEKIKEDNDYIVQKLLDYIDFQNNDSQNYNKDDIVKAFCSYVIEEEGSQKYFDLISAFIIKNKENDDFTKKLNSIKEGVILYSGIKYTSNLNEVGSWKTKFSVYLETEILFSLVGFNGGLYKILFDDLFLLIQEINEPLLIANKPKLINFKYFKETLNEIEQFFDKAQYILENNEKIDPSKPAMIEILNGCKTSSDVMLKKAEFFELLRKKDIVLDDDYYYEKENHPYNLEDEEIINNIMKEDSSLELDEVERSLKILNYINILRKGDSKKGFENIGFIILTEKNVTQRIAMVHIKEDGAVPLATSVNWLTNRLWFKLNKGFGDDNLPKSFDIITKAQTVLSAQINFSVSHKFYELKRDSNNGLLNDDVVIAAITGLREAALKPEDINESNADSLLKEISEDRISHFAREHDLLKAENQKSLYEIGIRSKEILEKDAKIVDLEKYKVKFLADERKRKKRKKLLIYILIAIAAVSIILFLIFKKKIFSFLAMVSSIITVLSFLGVKIDNLKIFFVNIVKKIKK